MPGHDLRTGPGARPPAPEPPAGRRPPPLLVAAATLAAGAAGLPAVYLVVRALEAPWGQIAGVVFDARTGILFRNTLGLSVAVTASALILGVPAAWLVVRTDLPLRRAWGVIHALPLVIPSYLGGYAFVAALGPRGMVQGWLEPLGVERLPEIYGFGGAWAVLSLFTYPYVYLSVRGALLRIDPALEEAAATLGNGPSAIFRRVVLPQIRPAVASAALLVALYTLHDFGAVSLLRFDSFSRAIYLSYEGSFDRTAAAIQSLVLVALCVVVLTGEMRLRTGSSLFRAHTGGGRPVKIAALGKYRWPAFGGCCLLGTLALLLPLTVVGYWFLQGLQAGRSVGVTASAAANSLSASAVGAAFALTAAWPLSALSARFPGKLSRILERTAFVGYSLPGVVAALALVFFGIRLIPALYQTRLMLGFAYAVLFLPLAAGALKTSLGQLSPRLDEAARTLGASRWRRLRLILLPALRPGLVAGTSLVFLSGMKELPATLLLAPIEFSTLATRVWSATQAASLAGAAAPALALVCLASAPLAYLLFKDADRALPLSGEPEAIGRQTR